MLNMEYKRLSTIYGFKSSILWLIAGVLLVSSSVFAADQSRQLEQVQKKIQLQQQNIEKRQQQIKSQQAQLKRSEVEIGRLSRKITENRHQISANKQKIRQLNASQTELVAQKQQQQAVLAKQLESAYRTGHYDYLKVILNQQDPEKIERSLTYFKYLNQARLKSLEQLKNTLDKLKKNRQQVEVAHQNLESQSATLKQQKAQREKQKASRVTTLAKMQKLLSGERVTLLQLQEAEIELQTQIKKAIQRLTRIKQDGLKKRKGKLDWPTSGKVRHRYGSRYTGMLKRKGLVIAAPEGREVSAVYSGQVVFANWLKGYGLVMVIDHGKGYMSLYGYNQSLLRQVGELVATGEEIATVGNSGGQIRSGLYFELRYQGKPINPASWLKKR